MIDERELIRELDRLEKKLKRLFQDREERHTIAQWNWEESVLKTRANIGILKWILEIKEEEKITYTQEDLDRINKNTTRNIRISIGLIVVSITLMVISVGLTAAVLLK